MSFSNSNIDFFVLVQNGTVPRKWHLKSRERVELLTGHYGHLEDSTRQFSKESANFYYILKIKKRFCGNWPILKKEKFSQT